MDTNERASESAATYRHTFRVYPGFGAKGRLLPIPPASLRRLPSALRRCRRSTGQTRQEVCERLGWPPGHLAALELGQRRPKVAELQAQGVHPSRRRVENSTGLTLRGDLMNVWRFAASQTP
ncbi:MAG TPA: helix-turn-helix transcriptional regulator [Candidatus Limnocylindrales bacterium]|nr:helix-turn-helix transcriptional regulator [Candidatus Limnocylindrales bacterium]